MEFSYFADEKSKMVQLLWKIVEQFFKMLNIQFLHDLQIPFLGIHLREIKTCIHVKIYKEMLIIALLVVKGRKY